MNHQLYPKYLKTNLQVFGLDLLSLTFSMFIGILVKRFIGISSTQLILASIAVTFGIIAIFKKYIPADYIYHCLTRKKVVVRKND